MILPGIIILELWMTTHLPSSSSVPLLRQAFADEYCPARHHLRQRSFSRYIGRGIYRIHMVASHPRGLSGGQRQFVALIRLLITHQVTRTLAQIIAAQRTQLVQSADGGTIKTLLVQEGDTVVPGQLPAELQNARASALMQDTQAKVAALKSAP